MKCITCNKEIPDASVVCPFCNNKVEPAISASEALGVTSSALPSTPTEYKLPKDQMTATQNIPVNTTDIMPPPPPVIGNEASAEEANENKSEVDVPVSTDIGTISNADNQVAVTNVVENSNPPATSNTLDVSSYNLDNIDLNANSNAESLDLTKENIGDKISNEAVPTKKKKITKKTIILLVVAVLVIGLGILGFLFYKKEYKSSSTRIKDSINRLFSFTSNISSTDYIKGTGSYELSYSHGNDDNKIAFELDGKYGYDIKSKKIDLIANVKNYQNNNIKIDTELNTRIYLEDGRAYFALGNFSDNYVYMDVKDSYSVIKDTESRFNNPDELFLFKNINYLFDSGLNEFTQSYATYINNSATNDINYSTIMNGLKTAITNSLTSLPSTQKIAGGNNEVRINLNSKDKVKKLFNNINESLHKNAELSKIYGDDLYNFFKNIIDTYDFKPINGDIVIVTDLFKGKLKYISIPTLKDDKVVNTKITPVSNGYKIVSVWDGNEMLNISYSKSSSSTSSVNTRTYSITGKKDGSDLNITIKINKDIKPGEVSVVTRNSIDYKYLTPDYYAAVADKIYNSGTFGELFKSIYKGIVIEDPTIEQQEGV